MRMRQSEAGPTWTQSLRSPAIGAWPIVLVLSALAFTAFWLKTSAAPFVWLGLLWTFVCVAAALSLPRPWSRTLFFSFLNAGVVAMAFAAAEAYLSREEFTGAQYSDGYMIKDEVLGVAPVKGRQAHAT